MKTSRPRILILIVAHLSPRLSRYSALMIFTSNNARVTRDMQRRVVNIVLDARSPDPTRRSGFKHDNLLHWVSKNRVNLVRACLMLIRHWLSTGAVHQEEGLLASFEEWHGVLGGILIAAGLGPLTPLHDLAREYVGGVDDSEDEMQQLVEYVYSEHRDDLLPVGGADDDVQLDSTVTAIAIRLGLETIYRNAYQPKTAYTLRDRANKATFEMPDGALVRFAAAKANKQRGWRIEDVSR